MAFNSPLFFIFLIACVSITYGVRETIDRSLILLAFNCIFCYLAGVNFIYIVLVTIASFVAARLLILLEEGAVRLLVFVFSLLFIFTPLLFFKYMPNVILMIMNSAASLAKSGMLETAQFPVGISFYTFLAAGFLIDVYVHGRAKQVRFIDFLAMTSFFPSVTSGPIARAGQFLDQLHRLGRPTGNQARSAFRAILLGLVLKIVVADTLSEFVNVVYARPAAFGGRDLWLANLYFAFQVYADFAGYSLIAIGSARLLGIELPANFRQPYFSRSIGEFWRRWHISLSSWFRDYVFTPLQLEIRRLGSVGFALALVFTFVLVGLWHGGSLNYVLFGLIHGVMASYSALTLARRDRLWKSTRLPAGAIATLRIVTTFALVYLTLVLFRAGSMVDAWSYYHGMLTGLGRAVTLPVLLPATLIVGVLFVDVLNEKGFVAERLGPLRWPTYYLALGLVCVFTVLHEAKGLGDGGFIYFRF